MGGRGHEERRLMARTLNVPIRRETVPDEDDDARPDDIRAFLESRRSPVAGLLIGSVALLLTAGLAWTAWARIDEVVRAQGKVEPVARVKLINHPHGGRVATLEVDEGDRVVAGQVLLAFAPEIDAKEHAELLGRWQVRTVEIQRLQAEVDGTDLAPGDGVDIVRPDLIEQAKTLLVARREARDGERDALTRNVEGHQSALRSAEAEVARLEQGGRLLEEQFAAVRELAERGLYPRLKMMDVERQLADSRAELVKARAAEASARAALAESRSRLAGFDKDWRRHLLESLAEAAAERDRLTEQLGAKVAMLDELVLTAPVDGIVQELKPAVVGQSLAANETILKLVPTGDGIVIRALVANADIGRIAVGMPVTIKVRAYEFARFGAIEGTVEQISADAIAADRPGEPPSFAVRIATDREQLDAEGNLPVLPGMAVDVEVRIGERTILSYFTDSLTRVKANAFKEG